MNFGTAARTLFANGYAPAPVTPGERQPRGAWAVHQAPYRRDELITAHADDDVAILTRVAPPRVTGGVDKPIDTYLALLELDADAEAAAGTRLGQSPVRVAADGSTLRPYRLDGESFGSIFFPDAHGRIVAGPAAFLVTGSDADGQPYKWDSGSPLDTSRARLPALDRASARELFAMIEAAL